MGHIRYASDVGAPVDVAFTYTDNHLFVPDWMFAVAGFEPNGDLDRGLGAHFRTDARLILLRTTLTCEITEYRRNVVIGYTLRGRLSGTLTLRFDPLGYGRSVLTSEVDYDPPRGLAGRLLARPIESGVRSALRRTESRLRREIEQFHGTDLVGRIA
ncbi:SRPBCC family protein [Nocardia cyriacigeorgica]|uniref:SRPBCC family protein n=1 Tax=Nocardia cyriacigeorgica TaxID=135487 RepID=UPI0018950A81|nr:SRPBCC family protein [Nocardia cyriacigeorgica]MBF6342868.1 SRPBCC family protein [Nocardia cyriacigeorgica]MBF6514774.1 SRPBCC family protein [Nocardia cyriacigeorgica]